MITYSLAVKLTGDSFWTTVDQCTSLAVIQATDARYASVGHTDRVIHVEAEEDGSRRPLAAQVGLYVEYLLFAHARGSLVGPGRAVRTLVDRDPAMCQAISDAFDRELEKTAAGRQCLAPAGDLSRQYNAITQDGPQA